MPSKVLKVQSSSCSRCASAQSALNEAESRCESLQSALDERDSRIADLLQRIEKLEGEKSDDVEGTKGGGSKKAPGPNIPTAAKGTSKNARAKDRRMKVTAAPGPGKQADLEAVRRAPSSKPLSTPSAPAAILTPVSTSSSQRSALLWFDRFEQLRKFHARHGHCLVGLTYAKLGPWVDIQRREYQKAPSSSKLSSDQRAALDSIGFRSILEQHSAAVAERARKRSTINDEEWAVWVDQAKAFKLQHGHLAPTPKTGKKGNFMKWVAAVRMEHRKRKEGKPCKLTDAQLSELDDLGLVWNPGMHQAEQSKQRWNAMLMEFVSFREKMGPVLWNSNLSMREGALYGWVASQRTEYKKRQKGLASAMTDEKVEKLEAAGFEWEKHYAEMDQTLEAAEEDGAHDESKECNNADENSSMMRHKRLWDQKFQSLKKFKEAHGHINVPNYNHHQYKRLNNFLNAQRSAYKRWKEGKDTSFTEERKAALESLGVDFALDKRKASEENFKKTWRDNFDRLKELKNDHGSLEDVPDTDPIHLWMNAQRLRYRSYVRGKGGALMEEHKAALDSLGFDWRTKTQLAWDENLNLLREFKRTNGHACIPQEGHELSTWARKQRQEREQFLAGLTTMSTERKERVRVRVKQLDELDFAWELQPIM